MAVNQQYRHDDHYIFGGLPNSKHQNRDAKAIHLKLDELIRSHSPAHNDMIDIEKLSDEELEEIELRYAAICKEHQSRQAKQAQPNLA
jgi:low affinity Fe/Cu permease